jgi:hypothetical protein
MGRAFLLIVLHTQGEFVIQLVRNSDVKHSIYIYIYELEIIFKKIFEILL